MRRTSLKSIERKFAYAWIISIVCTLFLCTGCRSENRSKKAEKVQEVLGTVVDGQIYGKRAKEALEAAFAKAVEIEEKMSVKKPESEISQVNEKAFKEDVVISAELYDVIERALYYADITEGALDPTIGKLIDLWGIGTEHERVPKESEIKPYSNLKNYKKVILNKEKRSIRFLDKDIKLDLGAIAKGYAADEMKRVLVEDYKIETGILNLGGNVITIGKKKDGTLWKVGITNPLEPQSAIACVNLDGQTVVTSGNYERFFISDGIRYHHILDPATGYPADSGVVSTTIIGASSIDADALSTATYIMGKEKAMDLLEKIKVFEGVLIGKDGTMIKTSGLQDDIFQMIK